MRLGPESEVAPCKELLFPAPAPATPAPPPLAGKPAEGPAELRTLEALCTSLHFLAVALSAGKSAARRAASAGRPLPCSPVKRVRLV